MLRTGSAPLSTRCVDTAYGGYLRRVFFWALLCGFFFCTWWTLAVVWCGCLLALVVGLWQWFVGSSPCEAAVVDAPLRRQLSGNLPHECHRQALADGLHGVGFCPAMEVGRGSVCDLEEIILCVVNGTAAHKGTMPSGTPFSPYAHNTMWQWRKKQNVSPAGGQRTFSSSIGHGASTSQ